VTDVREQTRPRWYTEPDRIEVGGTELALRRDGRGDPLLYLHGHWLTRCWSPFHQHLAAGADVIAPEAPGFGDSPCPAWITDRTDVVLLYRALLDELGLAKVHLAGHGLGAWLAADFAVLNPDRVRSLTVLAPYGLRVPGDPIADVFILNPADYADRYFSGDPVEGVVPGPGTPDQGGPDAFAQRYGDMGAAARLIWDFRYDLKLEYRLPRLRVPALVVAAEDDRIVPAAHCARWAELLGARLAQVPGGHAFPIQCPERAAELIRTFLSEVQNA
jgi:pimeloyl-ACP methyl ester carboxylesterase